MVHWVENKDQEPDVLVATKYQNDNVEDGVAFTRPLCVVSSAIICTVVHDHLKLGEQYPKLPYYKGGDEDDATSFVCQQ